jgi:hypothetical protein
MVVKIIETNEDKENEIAEVKKNPVVIVVSAVLGLALIIIFLIGVIYLFNAPQSALWNNKDIIGNSYEFHSYSVGSGGHVEYMKYSDSTSYIEDHSWWGSDNMGYHTIIDRNGDGKADTITMHGSKGTYFRAKEVLVREEHYASNKKDFDDADRLIAELEKKY